MLEFCLTRIFSMMMWYHFAFFTISVALFGFAASGLGCLASILVLDYFGGPGSMAFVGILAAIAGVFFLSQESSVRGRNPMVGLAVLAAVLAFTNDKTRLLDLKYYHGETQKDVVYEDWNSFSRVAVRDGFAADSLLIEIDAASITFAARWDGDRDHIQDVAEDLISMQYAFLERPKILAIGSGGSTDLLAGLAAGLRT